MNCAMASLHVHEIIKKSSSMIQIHKLFRSLLRREKHEDALKDTIERHSLSVVIPGLYLTFTGSN